jgi:hypothetical protein
MADFIHFVLHLSNGFLQKRLTRNASTQATRRRGTYGDSNQCCQYPQRLSVSWGHLRTPAACRLHTAFTDCNIPDAASACTLKAASAYLLASQEETRSGLVTAVWHDHCFIHGQGPETGSSFRGIPWWWGELRDLANSVKVAGKSARAKRNRKPDPTSGNLLFWSSPVRCLRATAKSGPSQEPDTSAAAARPTASRLWQRGTGRRRKGHWS